MEIIDQPRPISLDMLREKGARYRETGELTSDILGVVGDIPDTEKILEAIDSDSTTELVFTATEQGLQTQYHGLFGGEAEGEVPDSLNQAVEPVINLALDHFRKTFSLPGDVSLNGSIMLSLQEISVRREPYETDLPHTDNDLEHPEEEIGYLGSFGGPATKVWKGVFKGIGNIDDASEENFVLEEQIKEADMPLIELEEGKLLFIDSHLVHAAPVFDMGQNPEMIGKKRGFLTIFIKMPEATVQEAA